MTIEYEQWERILSAVNNEKDLSKGNVIEKVKEKLKVEDKDGYEEWEKVDFSVNHLFQHGLDMKCVINNTLLHLAIWNSNKRMIDALLAIKEINVNIANALECTPLHCATFSDNTEIAGALLKREEINVNLIDGRYGITALHWAANKGHKEMVDILLKAKGINVNSVGIYGYTPLHLAVDRGHKNIVDVLLEVKKINVNPVTLYGNTPLHIAANKGYIEIVKVLIENGADPLLKDEHGRTPRDLAANDNIKNLLKEAEEKQLRKQNEGTEPTSAVTKGVLAGGATAALGTAVAIALFATGTIAVELMPVVIAVAAIATVALAVGGVTYMMLKPSTKMDEVGEKEVTGNGQRVPPIA